MGIRRLDPLVIDRIAAGEVIERPAAAVKELVENALDAGARQIDVAIEEGGRRLIRVVDDGSGMTPEDLTLSVERHATSKLQSDDLGAIATFGFRGEALPSIASVSRLLIRSRERGSRDAWQMVVDHGRRGELRLTSHPFGTLVEVRDLFAATPARLKFLKSDQAERIAVVDAVRRLALTNPCVRFSLSADGTTLFDWPTSDDGRHSRVAEALGADFLEKSIVLDAERGGVRLTGFAARPTFNRPNSLQQHAFVNGRPVRDRLISGALRAGYLDTIPRGRHAAAVLFVDCDPSEVDVNVHPAKTEVRFRDPALVRAVIVGALQRVFAAPTFRNSAREGADAFAARQRIGTFAEEAPRSGYLFPSDAPVHSVAAAPFETPSTSTPLGVARAQLHDCYIVAETQEGFVIVDQHAAHERIVYEKLKRQSAETGVERQILLSPIIVDLAPGAAAALLDRASEIAALGLALESFGKGAVLVREAPTLVAAGDLVGLVRDLAEDALNDDGVESLERRLDHRLATIACHHSVRAGRALKPAEMDALLREMERTPNAEQCNHGRPTYVALSLAEVERMFGRR